MDTKLAASARRERVRGLCKTTQQNEACSFYDAMMAPKKRRAVPPTLQGRVDQFLATSRATRAKAEAAHRRRERACLLIATLPTPTPRPKRKPHA